MSTAWSQVVGAEPLDGATLCGSSATSVGSLWTRPWLHWTMCPAGGLPLCPGHLSTVILGTAANSPFLPLGEEAESLGRPVLLSRGPVLPLSSPTPSSTKPVPRACPPGPPPPSLTRCRAGPSGLPVLPARRFCALSPAPPARPAATPGAAAGLPVLAAPEPAVLQHQLVGRLGGARQGGGGAQGQRQGEGQQPHEERHGASGRGPREVRAPPPRARLSRRRAGGSGREGRGSRAPPPLTRSPRCAAPPQPQARAPRCALPGATGHPAAQRVWGAGSGDSGGGRGGGVLGSSHVSVLQARSLPSSEVPPWSEATKLWGRGVTDGHR